MEGAKKTSRRNSGRDSPTSSLAAHPGGRSSSSFFTNESHDEDDSSSGGEFETEKKRKTTTREKDAKKMEPAQVAKTFERRWVKIGDLEYDVTDMKHPGGSVIYYMLSNVGADATEAFREFHYRSRKAEKMLKCLPQRKYDAKSHYSSKYNNNNNNSNYQPIDTSDSAMLKDFATFRLGLEKDGYFTPSLVHVAYRIVELMFTFALATYLMAKGYTTLSVITYGAFFGARCGWVQHEGGHNSLTGNIWIDKRIQACLMGFGLGTSGDMWNVMHNKHHATPQKIRHDMDLDTTPAVAFFQHRGGREQRSRVFSALVQIPSVDVRANHQRRVCHGVLVVRLAPVQSLQEEELGGSVLDVVFARRSSVVDSIRPPFERLLRARVRPLRSFAVDRGHVSVRALFHFAHAHESRRVQGPPELGPIRRRAHG